MSSNEVCIDFVIPFWINDFISNVFHCGYLAD